MKLSYGNKLLFTFLLYGTFLTIASLFTIYTINTNNIHQQNINQAHDKAIEKTKNLQKYYTNIQDRLIAIKLSKTFKKYLEENNNYGTVRELFLNIALTSKDIMQLRYINNAGEELIRIDRDNPYSKPYFAQNMQNKADRYYYKALMRTPNHQVWHSSIDLNFENGMVEKPFKPVVRVGTPIFVHHQRQGFLIINIFMKDFLNQLIDSPTFNIYIVGENGEFKAHPNKNKTWSNYKELPFTIFHQFPQQAQSILTQNEFSDDSLFAKTLDETTQGQTKIIIQAKKFAIQQEIQHTVQELLMIMGGILILAFPLAYLFSRSYTKLKEKWDKLNTNLENKIDEKTLELQELNATLEQKVKDKVTENRQKDRLLFHQNKIAHISEMIHHNTHQWRQPLSAISSAASGIKIQKEVGVLSDENIDEAVEVIMKNANDLSQTIDEFKQFFKEDNQESMVNLASTIKDDLTLLKPTLKDNNINVVINLDQNIELKTIKNDLTQVHINIIYNAKDALLQEKNKDLKEKLIFIELLQRRNQAIIKILDNGGGIDKAVLDKIFKPYFSTKKAEGTGLGLFMCQEIITKHLLGTIEVSNQSFTYNAQQYHGAQFEIHLPIE